MQPSFETLRELIRACGYELAVAIVPREVDDDEEAALRRKLLLSPQERLHELLRLTEG